MMVAEVYDLPYQSTSSGSAGQPVLARQIPSWPATLPMQTVQMRPP
jgi:hypothetical protein